MIGAASFKLGTLTKSPHQLHLSHSIVNAAEGGAAWTSVTRQIVWLEDMFLLPCIRTLPSATTAQPPTADENAGAIGLLLVETDLVADKVTDRYPPAPQRFDLTRPGQQCAADAS